MKLKLSILFLLFGTIVFGQSILCKKREYVDKRGVCDVCNRQDELFSGLLIRQNDLTRKVYSPFKTKVYKDRFVTVIDAFGNAKTFDVTKMTISKDSLLAYLEGCQIDSTNIGGGGSSGSGDMLKSVYDTNNNGVVDNSSMLNGQTPSYYLDKANHTGVDNTVVHTTGNETLSGVKTFSSGGIIINRGSAPIGQNQLLTRGEMQAELAGDPYIDEIVNNEAQLALTQFNIGGLDSTIILEDYSGIPYTNNIGLKLNKAKTDLWYNEKLISGTNIKTVNGSSLLGSGNISISGGGASGDYLVADQADTSYYSKYFRILATDSLIIGDRDYSGDNGGYAYFTDYAFGYNAPQYSSQLEYISEESRLSVHYTTGTQKMATIHPEWISLQNDSGFFQAITDYNTDKISVTNSNPTPLSEINGFNILTKSQNDSLYQSKLVSGTNIKTINGTSLLGSGNISVSGGSNQTAFYSFSNIVTGQDSLVVTFPVTAGKTYKLSFTGTGSTALASNGMDIAFFTSAGATGSLYGIGFGEENPYANTALRHSVIKIISVNRGEPFSGVETTAVSTINTPMGFNIEATFDCTASGNVNMYVGPEIPGFNATFQKGTLSVTSN